MRLSECEIRLKKVVKSLSCARSGPIQSWIAFAEYSTSASVGSRRRFRTTVRKVCRLSILVFERVAKADRAACSTGKEVDLCNQDSQLGRFTKQLELLTREVAKDPCTPQMTHARMVPNE